MRGRGRKNLQQSLIKECCELRIHVSWTEFVLVVEEKSKPFISYIYLCQMPCLVLIMRRVKVKRDLSAGLSAAFQHHPLTQNWPWYDYQSLLMSWWVTNRGQLTEIMQTEVSLWPDISWSNRAQLHRVRKSNRGCFWPEDGFLKSEQTENGFWPEVGPEWGRLPRTICWSLMDTRPTIDWYRTDTQLICWLICQPRYWSTPKDQIFS